MSLLEPSIETGSSRSGAASRARGGPSAFGGIAEAVASRGVNHVVWKLPRRAAPAGVVTTIGDRLGSAPPSLGTGDPLAAGGLQLPPLRVRISLSLPRPHRTDVRASHYP